MHEHKGYTKDQLWLSAWVTGACISCILFYNSVTALNTVQWLLSIYAPVAFTNFSFFQR